MTTENPFLLHLIQDELRTSTRLLLYAIRAILTACISFEQHNIVPEETEFERRPDLLPRAHHQEKALFRGFPG